MKSAIDIEEISAQWLSAVLGYELQSIEVEKVGTGQTGAACRVSLDAEQGPKSVIVKVAAGSPEARQQVAGGYRREIGFYTHLQEKVDGRIPHCWHAGISEDCLHYTLVFEDLRPRVPGVQHAGCSVERARGIMRNLAGLHAPAWNDQTLFDFDFLTCSNETKRAKFLSDLALMTAAKFVERYRAELGAEDSETMLAVAKAIPQWATACSEPFTIVHGDYRLDNLMFGADNDDVVALDWQTTEIGPPTRDLAYFLGTSLLVDLRRTHERELVQLYFDELVSRGVKDYDFDQCFNAYRIGHLQGPLIASIGCVFATGERSEQSDAMFLAIAKRSCSAIRDLDSLELLRSQS